MDQIVNNLTIRDFCERENISHSTFWKMQRLGKGPTFFRVPGMAFKRITPEAYQAWRESMLEAGKQRAVALEDQRRSEMHTRAAKIAAASKKHVSKRKQEA